MRTLVVATDFSSGAELAVERAARIARNRGAALWLLHVFDDGVWASMRSLYDIERWVGADPVVSAREYLSQQAVDLSSRFGVTVRAETVHGSAPQAIAAFAKAQRADLLAMGVSSDDWLRYAMLGGSAQRVVEHADVPVLLVRRPAQTDFSHALVATDFSEGAMRAAQLALAFMAEARLTLLHAHVVEFEGRMRLAGATNEDIERYRAQERQRAAGRMEVFLAALGEEARRFEPCFEHGHAAAAILKKASEIGPDLIVIGKHGGSAFEERLLGSVTQNILYSAACDVLLSP
ncbi:TRAP-T-associated universal stress protein TeaD [Rhodocyclaceae bacterium]|nr:TRAP-T-associated universal stress protein TeaD [Rhodocyclaceae bacterium]